MKIVKRTNPRLDKLNRLRRKPPIPPSGHTPLTEVIGETERQIRKEIAIMKKCRHPHVVKLLEVIDDKLKSKIYMSKPPFPLPSPHWMSRRRFLTSLLLFPLLIFAVPVEQSQANKSFPA
jgi:serine/threonine protein kinase